jgi:allantoate deiminase
MVSVQTKRIDSDRAPSASDPALVRRLLAATEAIGISSPTMHSGAVHDAQQFAQVCPTAMIFVQSRGGVSHSPEEFSASDHIETGVSTLATMLHEMAYQGGLQNGLVKDRLTARCNLG